jgi:hypothetical protein
VIAVVDELDVGTRSALVKRHLERVQDQGRAHVRGELPANDPS